MNTQTYETFLRGQAEKAQYGVVIIPARTALDMADFIEKMRANGTDINVGNMISRQAAIDTLFELYEYQREIDPTEGADLVRQGVFLAEKRIENLPSAQPETAKRIVGKSRDGMTLWYQCDMCNEPVDAQDNFCRGCGRRLTDG